MQRSLYYLPFVNGDVILGISLYEAQFYRALERNDYNERSTATHPTN